MVIKINEKTPKLAGFSFKDQEVEFNNEIDRIAVGFALFVELEIMCGVTINKAFDRAFEHMLRKICPKWKLRWALCDLKNMCYGGNDTVWMYADKLSAYMKDNDIFSNA